MEHSMLKVEDIHVYYGESYILQGISLSVNQGEIVCILGRNGAGKTTTLRAIVGYNPPSRGSITFNGNTITGKPVYDNVRAGIGYVPEDRRIFPHLTVEENIEVAMLPARPGHGSWSVERIFDEFPMVARLRKRLGGELSGGEQQALAIARALACNPILLLLDEPCEGLAPVIVEQLEVTIKKLRTEMTILLAEQNARFALRIATRGYVIDKGKVCYEGTAKELMENEEVQCRYLAV